MAEKCRCFCASVTSDDCQANTSDKADDPPRNTAGDCIGTFHLSREGKTLAGGGSCNFQDVSGDGMLLWWKIEEVATAKCPDLCGSWTRTHVFANGGSLGTLKSTHYEEVATAFPIQCRQSVSRRR